MKDHHKLRIWDKTKKKMIYFDSPFDAIRPYTETSTLPQYQSCPKYHDVEIMGCTGLEDDKKKLIYEKDKVKIYHDSLKDENGFEVERSSIHVVEYQSCDEYPAYELNPTVSEEFNGFSWLFDNILRIEIIGNTFENPELLNKGE